MIARPILNQSAPKPRFHFPHSLSDLLHSARRQTIQLAVAAATIAWLPMGIMVALHGLMSVKLFLSDFAVQSRLLLVIPLLIINEPLLVARLEIVARHFVDADLVTDHDRTRFENMFQAFRRRGESIIARVVIAALTYGFAAYALGYFRLNRLPAWAYTTTTSGTLSAAGYWYIFAGLPLMLFLLVLWVWRLLVWSWFLRSVSCLDLRLIPAHPDQMGGLGFVQTCLRGYLPLCFAIGTIVAGGVANRLVHLHMPLAAFVNTTVVVIVIVFTLCVAPFLTFFGLLLRTRSRGIFEYGSLAIGMGHFFETKWLGPIHHLDSGILEKPDFSSTIDLFSVVAYVHQMKLFPVGLQGLAELAVATLAPAIPIALFAVPFDVLLQRALKLLL